MAHQGTLFEDDEDWLSPYLASTAYGKDPRLSSKASTLKTAHSIPKKVTKKKISLNASRCSLSLSGGTSGSVKLSKLPDRVNTIRDSSECSNEAGNKHFIQYHGNSDSSAVADESRSQSGIYRRRKTVDYCEIEALRERLTYASNHAFMSQS